MVDSVSQPDHECMSFGPYLRDLRLRKKISIEAVAAEIRISPAQVTWIEAEDHGRLPDAVYVKGILKSYARFIGVDESEVIDRYKLHRGGCAAAIRDRSGKETPGRKFSRRVWVLPRFLLILIAISVLYMIYQASLRALPSISEKGVRDVSAVYSWDAVLPIAREHDFFRLELDAREKTGVEIRKDDQEPSELIMLPMDHVELAVSRHVRLDMDNAEGLNVQWNGEAVVVPGKSGEAAVLELP